MNSIKWGGGEVMDWKIIKSKVAEKIANLPGADAQIVWAFGTDFAHLLRHQQPIPNSIPVLIELDQETTSGFAERVPPEKGHVPIANKKAGELGYCTAMLTPKFLKTLLDQQSKWKVRRVELQMPVIPQRSRPLVEYPTGGFHQKRAKSTTEVLLGVIDSDCPFAHPHFRDNSPGPKTHRTRVLNLWVQDDSALIDPEKCQCRTPADFRYGREANRGALNRLMRDSRPRHGPVNEAACYERAGAHGLRSRFTHGSAVLDLLAAPVPLSARMSDAGAPPPNWAADGKAASEADIVFVQLPQDTMQDTSCASLARHLLDGLQYIVSCASPETKRIVVNISNSSRRGSHDGDSIFEKALVALLEAEQRLQVVIGAGNNFDESRHAQLDKLEKGGSSRISLRIPPNCEAPAFAFVRIPENTLNVAIRLCAPSMGFEDTAWVTAGQAKALYGGTLPSQPLCTIVYPRPLSGSAAVAMLAWPPTRAADPDTATASFGHWTIEIKSESGVAKPIHLYIARNQTNHGAPPHGHPVRFIDPAGDDDPQRHLDPWEDDPEEPPFSHIRRRGGLNSLVTVQHDRLTVAGAYLFREKTPSLYSSEGPAAGGPRTGPSAWAPADSHRSLRGIRVLGGVAGTMLRATGTSFATPQVARDVANGITLPSPPSPTGRRRSRL